MSRIVDVSRCPLDLMYAKDRRLLGTSPASWRMTAKRLSSGPAATATGGNQAGGGGSAGGSGIGACSGNSLTVSGPVLAGNATKRRLSQVSAVVGRRLSTTIGWKNLGQWSSSVIATEAKGLCAQYIRARFRRSAIFHRKLGLQRLRSVVNMTNSYGGSSDTFQYLNILGKELENRHPKVYRSVCRQICRTLTSEETVHEVFFALATEIIPRDDAITLGRIVALFAMAGGLAVDCVQQGHVDYVLCLIESFGLFVERELATWVTQQGGWGFLVQKLKPSSSKLNIFNASTFIGFLVVLFLFLYFPLYTLLEYSFFNK